MTKIADKRKTVLTSLFTEIDTEQNVNSKAFFLNIQEKLP